MLLLGLSWNPGVSISGPQEGCSQSIWTGAHECPVSLPVLSHREVLREAADMGGREGVIMSCLCYFFSPVIQGGVLFNGQGFVRVDRV